MMYYKLGIHANVFLLNDGNFYGSCTLDDKEYLAWLAEGNTAEPADVPPEPTYQEQRALAYPSFADQFDALYHGGYDAWKATIAAVKEEFPK